MAAAQDITVYPNLLYRFRLPSHRNMALTVRLGLGINVIAGFYFDYGDGGEDPMTVPYLSLDAGVSFLWRFKAPFFVEAGFDFIHIFSSNDRSPMGYLRPALSLGGQF